MCGIVGYVQRGAHHPGLIGLMTDRLAHRGPDGRGVWLSARDGWHVALGHRRLAIIDIEGGRQPLGNEDGSIQITYNGEVYNFAGLRVDLERRGHRFATRSDTEVLVHHYEQAGDEGLEALNGIFAFGIWDHNAGRLLLARDRVGVKPLYYAPLPCGGIAFASELSALLLHPDVDDAIDPEGLACLLFADYVHPPDTIVRGARKLEPGTCLSWAAGRTDGPNRYWRPSPPNPNPTDEATLARLLIEKQDAAVASQVVADVPVGVFLSGGIDSSLVTALARRHVTGPLMSFSIGFADARFDESVFARRVAAHVGTRHIEQAFNESQLLDTLDSALGCLDEPIGDPSILPTYALSALAAGHVKVVLGGDGGDELWGGYPTYKAHRLAAAYQIIPRPIRRGVVETLVARLPVSHGYQAFEWKAKRFVLRWADQPYARHLRWMSSVDVPDLGRAIPLGEKGIPPALRASAAALDFHSVPDDVLALDLQTYLPGSVLTKVDRASMAHGLEVRPPMLDNLMIDFALSLPASVRMAGGKSKALLKRAASGLIPDDVIHRKKKGFAIPLARWLAGPIRSRVQDVIDSSPLWDIGLLDRRVFAEWLRQHLDRAADRSRPLWAAIVLDHWFRSKRMQQSSAGERQGLSPLSHAMPTGVASPIDAGKA